LLLNPTPNFFFHFMQYKSPYQRNVQEKVAQGD